MDLLKETGRKKTSMTQNCTDDGGTTSYYQFPDGVEQLQDLIEHRNMNFAVGNIFKAAWRLGQGNSDEARDLRKIIWFAERELAMVSKKSEQ